MLKNRVKELREAQGLTQERLARKLDVSTRAISMIESVPGYVPTMRMAIRLAEQFNCELGWAFWIERDDARQTADTESLAGVA